MSTLKRQLADGTWEYIQTAGGGTSTEVTDAIEKELVLHKSNKENPHEVTKEHIGLGNVDDVKQSTKEEFDAHVADDAKHTTSAERASWNSKANDKHEHELSDINGLTDGGGSLIIDSIDVGNASSFRDDVLFHGDYYTRESDGGNFIKVVDNLGTLYYKGENTDLRYAKTASIGDLSLLPTEDKYSIVGAVNELFTNVSDGKIQIATAITDKGGAGDGSESFSELATRIRLIETGIDTNDATAQSADILIGKTAYVNDIKVTGAMVDNGSKIFTPSNANIAIPKGYHDGTGRVNAVSVPATNVLTGTTIAGTAGTMPNQGSQGTITPTTSNKAMGAGYYNAFTVAGSSNLAASNIRSGVNIFGVVGNIQPRQFVRVSQSTSIPYNATSVTISTYCGFTPRDWSIGVGLYFGNYMLTGHVGKMGDGTYYFGSTELRLDYGSQSGSKSLYCWLKASDSYASGNYLYIVLDFITDNGNFKGQYPIASQTATVVANVWG